LKGFILKYSLGFLLILCATQSYGQFDTLNTVFKPRVGVGTGALTYYGEVQNYQIGYSPLVSRFGGSLFVNAPLSKYFNLEFTTLYGKVAANERTLTRNFNFESRIRANSLMLYYNFYPILSGRNKSFTPLLGVGFTSFEFLSKSDMYDANGNMYYYWSDGSIMNMPENDPNSSLAIPLTRDYSYETDLREQNYDSLGKYKEQSFAIPISIGGEWHIAKRFDFRVSTTMYYSFTDLIDNISPAGNDIRKGDTKKDYFMYTSASLSYDLEFNKKKNGANGDGEEDDLWLADFEQTDTDQDGVPDYLDKCAKTPLEAIVDEDGCPLDTDNDGVPDYYDEELATPEGNFVNRYGVTITEEEWLRQIELFNDSTGLAHDFKEEYTKVNWRNKDQEFDRTEDENPMVPKNYVLIIGKEHKSVSSNQLSKYLAWNEFKTITKGDTVYYVLGEYETIEDAVSAKTGLENEGVDLQIIGRSTHDNKNYIEVDSAVVAKVEKVNMKNGKEQPNFTQTKEVYRVQIGAFKRSINTEELFPGIDVIAHAQGKDGILRYYTGNFDTYEAAEAERKRLENMGYKTAFVTVYKDHERITLKDAGVTLPKNYSEEKDLETFEKDTTSNVTNNTNNTKTNNQNTDNNNSSINMDDVKYRVLLGKYNGKVPVEIIDIYIQLGGVKPVKNTDGSTLYYSKVVSSETEAQNLIQEYEGFELNDLKIVYQYNGKFYTQKEFDKLKGN